MTVWMFVRGFKMNFLSFIDFQSKMMGQCVGLPALPLDDFPDGNLPARIQQIAEELNTGQRRVFSMIMANLLTPAAAVAANGQNGEDQESQIQPANQQQLLLMLHGEAGTGKSFLYNKICDALNILVGSIFK